jgi:hypothetical protein
MPNFPNDPATRFLGHYGQYLIAKRQNEPQVIRLCAVACRMELRNMGDSARESQFCEAIFDGFVSREKAAQIYRELCEASSLYPDQAEN